MLWLAAATALSGTALLWACRHVENDTVEMVMFIAGMSLTMSGIMMFGLLLAL